MPIREAWLPVRLEIRRPFDAALPTASDVPCRWHGDLPRGRSFGVGAFLWSDWFDCNPDVDVRDAGTRTPNNDRIDYLDGDELRVTLGSKTWRFVVVWVEQQHAGTPEHFQRVYALRHPEESA